MAPSCAFFLLADDRSVLEAPPYILFLTRLWLSMDAGAPFLDILLPPTGPLVEDLFHTGEHIILQIEHFQPYYQNTIEEIFEK